MEHASPHISPITVANRHNTMSETSHNIRLFAHNGFHTCSPWPATHAWCALVVTHTDSAM